MEKDLSFITTPPIAHCGLHNDTIPENSLPAFENAVKHGYAIELDVSPTLDGVAVTHYQTVIKTHKIVELSSLKESELAEQKIINTSHHIPTLSEVFSLVNGKTPIFIDIKQFKKKTGLFEGRLLNLIRNYKGQVAVMAFNPYVIKWFKENAPDIPRGLLTTIWKKNMLGCPKSAFVRYALSNNILYKKGDADFLSINIDDIPTKLPSKFDNLPILGWTIDSQQYYEEKKRYVDNIIFENFLPKK